MTGRHEGPAENSRSWCDAGIFRILCVGLLLSQQILNTPLPEPLLAILAMERAAETISKSVGSPRPSRESLHNLQRAILYLRLRERVPDKLRYVPMLLHDSVRPTDKEHALVKLKGPLSFLYVLIRPVRLLVKYATAFLRK